jgi:Protein of unknown function (DUF2510)
MSYPPRPGDRDHASGRQPPGWYLDPRSYLDPADQQVLRWWDGARWGEQTRPLHGPPSGRRRLAREPWPRGLKVLAALGSLAALILVVVGVASLHSKQAANVSAVATTTPTRTPAHYAVSSKAVPTKAPVTVQAAAPAPVATTHATTHPPLAATTPADCHPLSNEGTCYEPGEYCRNADHGMSGIAGDGEAITCEDNDGWRWEPSRPATVRPTPTHTGTPTPTPTATPDNTSADPVNLGTLTYGLSEPATPCGWENLSIPEGYNVSGDQAWYEFTVNGFKTAGCPQPDIRIDVVGNSASSGHFGVAAMASGVHPDTPFGTLYHLPWPTDNTTYYIEVIGTGYFSVSV